MSPEVVIGMMFAVIVALIGVIYGLLRSEDQRLAKNIHSLRNLVQSVIMTLAARGIKLPKKDDE
jgi:inner membrane protein involved in colicin E2 resistance